MPKTFTQEEVLDVIRRDVNASSARQVAIRIGVSAAYLGDIINGNRPVSEFVASSFGFEREIQTTVVFRKIAA